MTPREYNKQFYPQYSKALSFISCLTNTLKYKCDEETIRQLNIIGWDEETEKFLYDALSAFNEQTKKNVNFYGVDEETAEKIQDKREGCIELCSGGRECLSCNRYRGYDALVEEEIDYARRIRLGIL